MRSWISAYMKLSGSEDAVQCGDKEGRNDDHAFWLEAAETGETLAKKEGERERERERNDRSNVTSLPSFSAGQWKIHLHCSTSVCSFQLCIFHWTRRAGGILPAGRCEYLSLFEKNFDLMCNFSNYSNSACLVIINHKHKTKVHRL